MPINVPILISRLFIQGQGVEVKEKIKMMNLTEAGGFCYP